jgi:hypothetical protein
MTYARITKDLLYEAVDASPDRTGDVIVNRAPHEAEHIKVRLLDDDGIVYYEGIADQTGMEVLFDWSQKDSGTTLLQEWDRKTKKWKDVIG